MAASDPHGHIFLAESAQVRKHIGAHQKRLWERNTFQRIAGKAGSIQCIDTIPAKLHADRSGSCTHAWLFRSIAHTLHTGGKPRAAY